jgi:uncharacterized membrane protein
MANLVVFAFDAQDGASKMAEKLGQLQKQQLITLADAAIVTRKDDGKPKVQQLNSLVGAGALGGAFWGMLFGMLFFMPWMGMAIGSISGAIAGKFSDVGIDDTFIKEVSGAVQPGQSALFLLVDNAVVDKVIPEIKDLNPQVIKSSLSTDQEAKLKELLA